MPGDTDLYKRTAYIPQQEKTHEMPDELLKEEPKRLLMLEDDPILAGLLAEALETISFGTTKVSNGVEGLKAVMATDFDIIVCDMVMPQLAGDMFYLAVERTRPHLCKRFIFMTAHRSDKKWDAFARSKGCIILWKPFELQVFLETVQVVYKKNQAAAKAKAAA